MRGSGCSFRLAYCCKNDIFSQLHELLGSGHKQRPDAALSLSCVTACPVLSCPAPVPLQATSVQTAQVPSSRVRQPPAVPRRSAISGRAGSIIPAVLVLSPVQQTVCLHPGGLQLLKQPLISGQAKILRVRVRTSSDLVGVLEPEETT